MVSDAALQNTGKAMSSERLYEWAIKEKPRLHQMKTRKYLTKEKDSISCHLLAYSRRYGLSSCIRAMIARGMMQHMDI